MYDSEDFKKEFSAPNVFFEELYADMKNMSKFEWFIKKIKGTIQATRKKTKSYEIMLARFKKTNPIQYFFYSLLKPLLKTRAAKNFFDYLDIRLFGNKKYDVILEKYEPDMIFFASIYDYDMHPLMRRSYLKKIPAMMLTTSWDNLTKGTFITPADSLLVWNKIMYKEARELYDYKPEQIHVVGAPSFDFYHDAKLLSRAEFCKRMGLDPKKKIIVYASVTKGLCVDETFIVEDLISFIEDKKLVEEAQVFARIYSRRDINEYKRFFKNPNIVFDQPKIEKKLPDMWNPDKEAMLHIANTLKHGDVFVTSSTTMVLEAAAFDLPIINWAYDEQKDVDYLLSIRRYYDYTHWKPIVKSKGVSQAHSKEELADQINAYLKNPQLHADGRKKIIEWEVGDLDGNAGKRIGKVILDELNKITTIK